MSHREGSFASFVARRDVRTHLQKGFSVVLRDAVGDYEAFLQLDAIHRAVVLRDPTAASEGGAGDECVRISIADITVVGVDECADGESRGPVRAPALRLETSMGDVFLIDAAAPAPSVHAIADAISAMAARSCGAYSATTQRRGSAERFAEAPPHPAGDDGREVLRELRLRISEVSAQLSGLTASVAHLSEVAAALEAAPSRPTTRAHRHADPTHLTDTAHAMPVDASGRRVRFLQRPVTAGGVLRPAAAQQAAAADAVMDEDVDGRSRSRDGPERRERANHHHQRRPSSESRSRSRDTEPSRPSRQNLTGDLGDDIAALIRQIHREEMRSRSHRADFDRGAGADSIPPRGADLEDEVREAMVRAYRDIHGSSSGDSSSDA